MTKLAGSGRAMSLCQCGCGELADIVTKTDVALGWVKGQPKKFAKGHYNSRRPALGRYRSRRVSLKEGGGKQVQAHALIAEAAIGKPLPAGAVVHHIDGDGLNNSPSNLVICQDQRYHMLIHARARIVRAGGSPEKHSICGQCRRLLSRECFHKRLDGRQGRCRACCAADSRARRSQQQTLTNDDYRYGEVET